MRAPRQQELADDQADFAAEAAHARRHGHAQHAPSTQKVYSCAVANFARYRGQFPDPLGLEDVRDYRLYLLSRGLEAKSINPIVVVLSLPGARASHHRLLELSSVQRTIRLPPHQAICRHRMNRLCTGE
jgi:hypothetical protein